MDDTGRQGARAWLLTGLGLYALSVLVNVIRDATSVGFVLVSLNGLLEFPLSVLAALVSLVSWAWLSKIELDDAVQRRYVRNAMLGLSIVSAIQLVIVVSVLWQLTGVGSSYLFPRWIEIASFVATTVGYALLAGEFSSAG